MKYKLSKYVHFLQYDDSLICMQMIKRLIFALEGENSKLLINNADRPDIIENLNPHLFSALKKLGVIVEKSVDEFEEIKKINENEIYSKKLRLTIIPTLDCNLSCWYCYETHTKGIISDEIINSILKFIQRKIDHEGISEIELDWFGGEPLLFFADIILPTTLRVKAICQTKSIDLTQVITTNGTLINANIVNSFQEIGLNNFQITLDGKKEIHNKIRKDFLRNGTYDTIINAINLITETIHNAEVLLRINYSNESIKSIQEIIKDFKIDNRKKVKVLFQQVWQLENKNKPVNLDPYYDYFSKAGFQVEQNRFNRSNIACYADKYFQVVVNYNGDVFKCTARDFADRSLRAGFLNKDGIVFWDLPIHKERFQRSSIENEFCFNCPYVPLCYGPCSQKRIELGNIDSESFGRICYKSGLKISVEREMIDFYEKTFNQNT